MFLTVMLGMQIVESPTASSCQSYENAFIIEVLSMLRMLNILACMYFVHNAGRF